MKRKWTLVITLSVLGIIAIFAYSYISLQSVIGVDLTSLVEQSKSKAKKNPASSDVTMIDEASNKQLEELVTKPLPRFSANVDEINLAKQKGYIGRENPVQPLFVVEDELKEVVKLQTDKEVPQEVLTEIANKQLAIINPKYVAEVKDLKTIASTSNSQTIMGVDINKESEKANTVTTTIVPNTQTATESSKGLNSLKSNPPIKTIVNISSSTSNTVEDKFVLSVQQNTEVFATATGTITLIGENDEYGKFVVISDSNKNIFIYGKLSNITVTNNSQINKGDKIATSTSTLLYIIRNN